MSIYPYLFKCTCGHSGGLTVHGYYTRWVRQPSGPVRLKIMRLKCTECGRTHAVLPSCLVPYSQIRLEDHASIITRFEDGKDTAPVMDENPEISPGNIRHIISMYLKHWKERISSARIEFSPIRRLVERCFENYSRQFMQIKKTPNILFARPT